MAGRATAAQRAVLWAVLTCLIAAATGLVAYWSGRATQGDRDVAAAPTPAPALLPLGDVYASAHRKGERDAWHRAYVLGRRMERSEYRPGARGYARIFQRAYRAALGEPLRPAAWYLVATTPDGRGLSRRYLVKPARAYALCRGSAAVCATPIGGSGQRGPSSRDRG